jgi:hypothetical protein
MIKGLQEEKWGMKDITHLRNYAMYPTHLLLFGIQNKVMIGWTCNSDGRNKKNIQNCGRKHLGKQPCEISRKR